MKFPMVTARTQSKVHGPRPLPFCHISCNSVNPLSSQVKQDHSCTVYLTTVLSSSKSNIYESVCDLIHTPGLFPTPCTVSVHSGCSVNAFGLGYSQAHRVSSSHGASSWPLSSRSARPPHLKRQVLSQVAKMQEGRPHPAWETFTAQLGETDKVPDKCCVKSDWQSVPGCHGNRGPCKHKNEHSSLHLCIAFSFSKDWVWGWGLRETEH